MKKMFISILSLISLSSLIYADTASGKITQIQVSNHNTIYFKMDPMPKGVTKWFYMREKHNASGCNYNGNAKMYDQNFSALLSAKAMSADVTIGYCQDHNNYGLINGFFKIN